MFTRKIGKLLRGNATAFQIISATILGALMAGSPGWGQAPLWNLLLFFLLLILNANLFLAGLTFLGVKLISLLLLPVYFQVGMSLVEGPLNGLVAAVANAPVSAWFGWEYYVTLPSLSVALIIGTATGFGLIHQIKEFRKRMASLETGSDKFKSYTAKGWVKALAWIFFGGLKGKQSWEELSKSKKGRPVRFIGIIFVLSLSVLLFVGLKFMQTSIATSYLRAELEKINGATVDLDGVEIDASQNQVRINGLAMANPNNLGENRFAAEMIIADISGMQLLAKKIEIDRLEAINAVSSTPRRLNGVLIGEREDMPEVDEEKDVYTIDDYLKKGAVWKERLRTLQKLYDRIAPYITGDKKEEGVDREEKALSWRERLELEAAENGYSSVKSDTVIRKSPQLVVRVLEAKSIEVGGENTRIDVVGSNLSTQPQLLEGERGSLKIARSDDQFAVNLTLPGKTNPGVTNLQMHYDQLDINELNEQAGGKLPLKGGTMNLSGSGEILWGVLSLPLQVELIDTQLAAFGENLKVESLPIEVGVSGTIANPKLSIPSDQLQKALKNAAVEGVKNKLEDEAKDKILDKAGDNVKKLFGGFGG